MENAENELESLRVFLDDTKVFSSKGRWLHPLFELGDYLQGANLPVEKLQARDRVVGKAAALLMVRLGLRSVHAEVLSSLGEGVFRERGVSYTYDVLVDRIGCSTEELLASVDDVAAAYELLAARAKHKKIAS